ncbi:Membrane-bound lytic murein transglycosylase F [Roseobacter fucihabitans]|uniref:Membrane-bound lytic murein transglycosylase F n=1 Tax=Roseobacter fucihabitans TaxID=1537242 RepID=A0ABZ2BLT7_9RHOB|nr:transporter substrate-binding domain-containing protein [Roseobacter litoralis]MBC6963399.1 Major cell-binding factor precursor [Roseobacter litoralis]
MNNFLTLLMVVFALLSGPVAAQSSSGATLERRAQVPENPGGRLEHILRRGSLIVGVKDDYPPMGFRDPVDDTLIGFEPDMARAMAERLGVALELVAVTSSNRLSRVNQGQIDLVIATMGDTKERRTQAGLIQPTYYASGVALLAQEGQPYTDWGQLRGRPVCMVQGAYYNRTLDDTYLVSAQYFPSARDAMLALRQDACVGWAFDDVALVSLTTGPDATGLAVSLPSILTAPWAVAVAKGEEDADWGRFVSDLLAEWHAAGKFLTLQQKWGLLPNPYLSVAQETWSRQNDGTFFCARDPETGAFSPSCVTTDVLRTGAPPVEVPPWAARIQEATGWELSILFDAYDRTRLTRGLGMTLALSLCAIIGALCVGIGLGLLNAVLSGGPVWRRALRMPVLGVITLSRMTPPILQLYIVFFGLGGLLSSAGHVTPGAFVTATLIFSFYAGATNAVLITHALEQERAAHPEIGLMQALPRAVVRSYDGLVSTCVNIVKAAGMASAIALTELIATVNLIITEGGDASVLMNGLLLLYFVFVMGVMWLFRGLKAVLLRKPANGASVQESGA